MTSTNKENNEDILENLNEDKSSKEINNDDLVSMFNLPEKEEIQIDETKSDNKNIYDININSLNDILLLLEGTKYDFVTFEPNDSEVKIDFRKNNVIIDSKFIKFPIYSNILIKAKSLTKLKMDETNQTQEGNGGVSFDQKNFQIITKTVPSNFGEKLYIKAKLVDKLIEKKPVKKATKSQIFSFLGILGVIGLIVGGSFLTFIVLNAKTVDDVRFFAGLGINLNEINAFIAQLVTIIFSILVLAETIILIIFLFKFFLTKKEFKKRKIKFGILSILLLIITFTTTTIWMVIDQKIKTLPNWQEMSFGEIQMYDNSKLTSEYFDKIGSLLTDTKNLIGPIDIKFDLTYLAQAEEKRGVNIKNYSWDFGDGSRLETIVPNLIKTFDKVGSNELKLTINGIDSQGKAIEKVIENIPYINIAYVVGINEKKLNSGGKLVNFNAKSLEELGSIEWYSMDNLEEPIWKGSEYIVSKPIFENTIIGMYIKKPNQIENNSFDKLFIIKGEDKVNIDGEIEFKRGLVNDLDVTFSVTNVENDSGVGYIEKYIWSIGNQTYTKVGDILNPEKSSEVKYTFVNYGEETIKVELINSAGESKTITKTISLPKILKIDEPLKIYTDNILLSDVTYNKSLNEYFINNLGTPTKLKLDGKYVKPDSTLYNLKEIEWDFDSDGNIDYKGNIGEYELNKDGNYIITIHFYFVNRKVDTDIVKITEKMFIEANKKEAIVDFDIIAGSEYAPVIVKFDASRSQVRDSNISKFIWDYGDGVKEERDAIVPGRRYTEAGDYDIKLTVVTSDGKSYSTSKKLVLKPTPQSAKIKVSMKKAPTLQGIDFTSNESEGQISSYFWNFGDGNTSTEANPTHTYGKPGIYKVTLKLDFTNKNILEDYVEVEIYE